MQPAGAGVEADGAPGVLARHPMTFAVALIGVVGAVIAAGIGFAVGGLRTSPGLTITSPQALMAMVASPHGPGWSGTAVAQTDLALSPAARRALADAVPAGQLLSGSATLRFWYGGPAAQRIAVIHPGSEQDVFRQGRRLWSWDTTTAIAQRVELARPSAPIPVSLGTAASFAPPTLAQALVTALGGASDVTLRSGPDIADRETYELVLRPDSAASLIGAVEIDVDGTRGVPLAVRVYGRSAADGATPSDDSGQPPPILDTSFTSVWLAPPPRRNFTFDPPAGASVRRAAPLGSLTSDSLDAATYGSGWQKVLAFAPQPQRAGLVRALAAAGGRRVRGPWGAGWLLATPLFDVLATDTDWVVAGAVDLPALTRTLPPAPRSTRTRLRPPAGRSHPTAHKARRATAGNPRPRRRGAR